VAGLLDRTEFDRWREAADHARDAASVQAEAGYHNWACFLAEQAAQLGLKGLLRGIGAAGWGHDLVDLGRMVAEALDESLSGALKNGLRRLSRHYIPARYPDAYPAGSPGEHYGIEDSATALEDAQRVLEFVDRTWNRLEAGGD